MCRSVLAAAAVVMSVVMLGCGPASQQGRTEGAAGHSVTVKGSDTMVHLVTAWSESYMETRPGSEISVTGGGSGTGIAALLNGTTDICAASRDMSQEEKDKAAKQGLTLRETDVARDGIAVIIHPSNPIDELTTEQLKKIFTGAYTDWKEVGGSSGQIIVLSRESSSGTYIFFQEHVLKKEDFTPSARLMPATSAIIQSVTSDALAIGYVGLGYAEDAGGSVKTIKVKADAAALAIAPSEDTVRSGTYPISRPLHFYSSANIGETGDDFIKFCLSGAGQAIVREAGYIPVQ